MKAPQGLSQGDAKFIGIRQIDRSGNQGLKDAIISAFS